MAVYLLATGKKVIDRSRLTDEERAYEKSYPLWKAFMPWIILIVAILALNLPKPAFEFLYRTFTMPVTGISADGSGIPTRALWNAYTWILVSTLLSIPFLKPTGKQLKETLKVWWKRAPRPVFSAAIFFSIGEIMNMSGFSMADGKFVTSSMVNVLANASAKAFHDAYGAIVAFIGLFGGFLTGSEASAIAMFSKYTMSTASELGWGLQGLLTAAAGLAFGGGLASIISPAKLQNAAASIDKLGEENKVIRVAFIFSFILTAVTSVFVILLLNSNMAK
jgi:lactate permease